MKLDQPPRALDCLTKQQRDTDQWNQVNLNSIKEKRNRERFLTLRNAILDYMQGVSPKTICDNYEIRGKNGVMRKLCKSELFYFRDRCLEEDANGNMIGFPALLKYCRINKKIGPLMELFLRYPLLERYMQALFFKRARELGQTVFEIREPYKGLHKKFLDACASLGIPGNEYPYFLHNKKNKSKGEKALTQYFKDLIDQDPARAGLVRGGDRVGRKMGSGQDHVRRYATEPLEVVEFDAHCIDALWTIKVWDEFRKRFVTVVLNRVWLLVVIDQFSRAVLGYHLCLKDSYSQYDVMRTIKRAVEPWSPMDFVAVETFKYPPRGGFPSGVIDRYAWALWDLIIYDNAWANLAAKTREVLKNSIGSDVNAGPKYTSDHQPFVERFNGTFTKAIMQRLPNTTGKSANDPSRQNPEKTALELDMNVDELQELVEIALATYNATPHSAHGDMSPMQVLDQFAADPDFIIKTLPQNRRSQLSWLNVEVTRKVRGGLQQQRRPYVHLEGVDYNNEVLRGAPSMVGKTIKLVFDPTEDARTVAAYTEKGGEIGLLKARGQWAISPHTFDLRKEIIALKQAKKIFYTENDDPVQVYIDHLNEKSLRSRRSRGRLITAQKQSGRPPKEGNGKPPVGESKKPPRDNPVSQRKGVKSQREYSTRKARNI